MTKLAIALVLYIWVRPAVLASDPSSVPCQDGERFRICTDVDGDGLTDLILSQARQQFGNGGGGWDVFLQTAEGHYVSAGRIGAQRGYIRVENYNGRCRLWVWWRLGGWVGKMGYHEVKNGTVGTLVALEIYPGDGGTEPSRAIFAAVFPEDFDSGMEESITAGDTVTWRRVTRP